MSIKLVNCLVVVLAIVAGPALAGGRGRPDDAFASVRSHPLARRLPATASGQAPAPRELADRSALPACGFAADESWGPNGFQYCDSRNVHGDAF